MAALEAFGADPDSHLPRAIYAAFLPALLLVAHAAARRDAGAGLGLAICDEIALAHGWTLVARNGTVGAEFLVSFEQQ